MAAPMGQSQVEGPVIEGTVTEVPGPTSADSSLATGGEPLVTDTGSSAQSTPDVILDSSDDLAGKATESVSSALKSASSLIEDLTKQLQSAIQSATDQIDSLGKDASSALQETVRSIDQSLDATKTEVYNSIPPEFKNLIEASKPYVKSSTDFAIANRTPLLVGAAALLIYWTYSYYKYRFVGYSGDLYPEKALALLQSEAPALLVDIRREDRIERQGIPKLRRQALGKAISIPYIDLSKSSIKRKYNVTPDFNADITAAYIAGHRQASLLTSFVVMGDDEEKCRDVARALRRLECNNAYVMFGGFAAWVQSGLPVSDQRIYDVTPIEVLSDRAVGAAEPLTQPINLLAAGGGVVAAAWLVLNYQYVLELLGVIGPILGLGAYLVRKYDSPNEFVGDIDSFLTKTLGGPEVEDAPSGEQELSSQKTESSSSSESNETAVAE